MGKYNATIWTSKIISACAPRNNEQILQTWTSVQYEQQQLKEDTRAQRLPLGEAHTLHKFLDVSNSLQVLRAVEKSFFTKTIYVEPPRVAGRVPRDS